MNILIPYLVAYLKGYLVITVTGNFPERFLNVCSAKNILLWDITSISKRAIRCKISARAFKKLPQITYHTAVKVEINAKKGFPFLLNKYRHRRLFITGIALFFIFVIVANQFVWGIEIRGNERIKAADILKVLEEEGVKRGAWKNKIDQRTVKNHAMLKLPSLAWLWVDKKGSKIIVDVRERIPVPEMINPDEYYNIVAAKDGVIDAMVVRNGIPVTTTGDTVLKDMVLVTGKIPSSIKNEIRYEQADAQIFARVWYEKKAYFSRISIIKTQTGKEKKQFTLKIFGKTLPLFHRGKTPFARSEETVKEHVLSSFGRDLGISLISHEFKEITQTEELHTEKSVAEEGIKKLKQQIDDETLPDATLISVTDDYQVVDETTIFVTVKAEYREDIAKKVPGEKTTPETDESPDTEKNEN